MRVSVAVLAAVLAFGSGPAWAQMDSREAIQLQNEILGLQRDIQALQQNQGGGSGYAPPVQAAPGGGGDSNLTAQLLDRVTTLEEQVRQMRGQVDSFNNQLQRQNADLSKQISDLQFQLQNGGGGGGGGATAPAPRGASSSLSPPPGSLGGGGAEGGGAPPPRTPEVAMQEGSAALARRDYPAAEAAAREVLAKKGPRQLDAQFLLSQAELGQHNFQQAAPNFYDVYNRARTGPHAPDALLGVADSLTGLGDKTSACEALAKLRTEFPTPRPDVRAREVALRQRAACH